MKKVLVSLACLIVLAALYACSTMGNEKQNNSGSAAGTISFERISPEKPDANITGK